MPIGDLLLDLVQKPSTKHRARLLIIRYHSNPDHQLECVNMPGLPLANHNLSDHKGKLLSTTAVFLTSILSDTPLSGWWAEFGPVTIMYIVLTCTGNSTRPVVLSITPTRCVKVEWHVWRMKSRLWSRNRNPLESSLPKIGFMATGTQGLYYLGVDIHGIEPVADEVSCWTLALTLLLRCSIHVLPKRRALTFTQRPSLCSNHLSSALISTSPK